MRIVKYIVLICLIGMFQPYAQAGQTKLEIKLHGNGTVTEKQGMKQIHAEGTVRGDVTGTFIWEEEHQPGFEMGTAVENGTMIINDNKCFIMNANLD